MNFSTIATAVQLASQFGPFLFAILFILVVTRTARGYYNEANTRTNPPASPQEIQAYKFYFMCSVWCGIGVMVLSIAWWFYVQSRGTYVYQVAIINLTPDETISADYYEQTHPHPVVVGGINLTDDYFIIVQDHPFNVGDKFDFALYKKPPANSIPAGDGVAGLPIEVTFTGKFTDRFRVQFDDRGQPELVVADKEPTENFFAADLKKSGINLARNLEPQTRSAGIETR